MMSVAAGLPAVTLIAHAQARAATAEKHLDPAKLKEIQAALEAQVENGTIPGAVVLVAQDGKPMLKSAIGFVDADSKAPMQFDSLFRVASMTKPIVTTAAMMLVEAGKLDLDAPIADYLPELKDLVVAKGDATVPAQRPILVKDLMRHTSGFTYSFAGAAGEAIRSRYKILDVEQQVQNISQDEMLKRLATVPLAFQPGTRFEYSVSVDVLGFIVERIEKKPLDVVLEERIFKPLTMTNSMFDVPQVDAARLAQPLSSDKLGGWMKQWMRVTQPRSNGYVSGGGGLVTTAEDYWRFSQMILNGGILDGVRILDQKTVDLMLTDHIVGLAGGPDPLTGPGYGFGYGFAVRRANDGGATPGTKGDANWSGLSGTTFTIDRQNNLIGILLIAGPATRNETRFLFKNKIYSTLDQ